MMITNDGDTKLYPKYKCDAIDNKVQRKYEANHVA